VSRPLPAVRIEDGNLQATLSERDAVRTSPFECIVDRTGSGDLVGVEILSLHAQVGAIPPVTERTNDRAPRWSYDPEVDAFYLRVAVDTAPKQQKASGRAGIDESDMIVSIAVQLTPPE
jgi:hypothetical protein